MIPDVIFFFVVHMSYDLYIFWFMKLMYLEIKGLLMCDDVGGCPEAYVDLLDVLCANHIFYYCIIIIIAVQGIIFRVFK